MSPSAQPHQTPEQPLSRIDSARAPCTEQFETTHMPVRSGDLRSLAVDAVAQADMLVGEFGPSWQKIQDL